MEIQEQIILKPQNLRIKTLAVRLMQPVACSIILLLVGSGPAAVLAESTLPLYKKRASIPTHAAAAISSPGASRPAAGYSKTAAPNSQDRAASKASLDDPAISTPRENDPGAEIPVINQALSLEAAVKLALQYSPMILEAQEDAAMAEARVLSAQAAGSPTLSATLFGSRSSWNNILTTPDVTPPINLMGVPPGNFLDQNVTGMFPVYTGGRVQATSQAARSTLAASMSDLNTSRQDTALQTRIAYRRVLYQKSLVEAQQQNLAAVQEQLRLDLLRYQVGKIAGVTLYRDRTQAATAQQDVTNAVRDWKQSLYTLETAMGISLQSNITLTDTLEPVAPVDLPAFALPGIKLDAGPQTPARMPAAVDQVGTTAAPAPLGPGESRGTAPSQTATPSSPYQAWEDIPAPPPGAELAVLLHDAAMRRPEIQAAVQRTAAAAAQVSHAKAAYRPQVNIMGMGDLTGRGSGVRNGLNYTLGIAAGLPIFEGGALSAAEREARAALAKAKAVEQAVRLQVNNEVAAAWTNQDAALQNLTTSQVGLQQAQQDYSVQQFRFTSGKGIQVEVLDALASLTSARTQVQKARFELAVAQDQLSRATGTILQAAP